MASSVINPFAQALPQEIALPQALPDFSQIQNIAMRANSIFEQNLGQVKNDYSAVLNAPVTGDAMQEKKAQYINNFRQGLKKVASSDLSMPQNVLQAENLLQPFWSDQDMLINMDGTKSAHSNIKTIQNGLLSKEDKERDMYNPIQVQDQQDYLQELADAGTDHDKLMRLQKRTIAPFTNLTKLFNDRAKDQKLEIKYTEGTNSPYLVSTVNGKQTIPNFETWARGQLGPEQEGMFQTIGRVGAKHARRKILEETPGIPESEVNKHIAEYTYDKLDKGYQHKIADYTTNISDIDKQLVEIEDRSPMVNGQKQPTENDMPLWLQLRRTKQDYEGFMKSTNDQYITFRANKTKTLEGISADPQDAFAQIEKDNRVSNWATGAAANMSVDIKKNDAYFTAMTEARELRSQIWKEHKESADIDIERSKLGLEGEKLGEKAASEHVIRDKNGNWIYDPAWAGVGTDGKGMPVNVAVGTVNADNTDPLHVPNPLERYTAALDNNIKDAHNALFGIGGAAGTLVDTPVTIDGKSDKISIQDVDLSNQALQKKFANPSYIPNTQEAISLRKIGIVLGAKDFTDPLSMKQALETKLGQVQMNKDGTPNLQSLFLANQITNAENALQDNVALVNQKNDAVKSNILAHPAKNKNLIINRNGRPDIVTKDDIAKDFPTVTAYDASTGQNVTITPAQFAEAHINGTYKPNIDEGFLLNGKQYKTVAFTGPRGSYDPAQHDRWYKSKHALWQEANNSLFNTYIYQPDNRLPFAGGIPPDGVINKYGTSEDFANRYKAAQNEVISSLPTTSTGLRGFQLGYNRNNPAQLPTMKAITSDLAVPSNTLLFKTPDGTLINDDKDIAMFRLMFNEGDKYVNSVKQKPYAGTSGGPAIQVDFSPRDMTEGQNAPGYVDLIKKYPSVIVDAAPDTKSQLIRNVITRPSSTQYGDMMTGTKYGSNTVMKAHNFDCEIHGTGEKDANGHYKTFAISGTYGYLNPVTGKVEKRAIRDANGQIVQGSFDNTMPYQVMEKMNEEFQNKMMENIANYNQYKAKDHKTVPYNVLEQQFQNQK